MTNKVNFIQDPNITVAFVNTETEPDEVIRHNVYRYTTSIDHKHSFYELVTKVYIHQEMIRYQVLTWEEVQIPVQYQRGVINNIESQNLITTVVTR